jgi:hypothetical protein
MSLMTRFLRMRLGRAARPAADLVESIGGAPRPEVVRRATVERSRDFGFDPVATELVDEPPSRTREESEA